MKFPIKILQNKIRRCIYSPVGQVRTVFLQWDRSIFANQIASSGVRSFCSRRAEQGRIGDSTPDGRNLFTDSNEGKKKEKKNSRDRRTDRQAELNRSWAEISPRTYRGFMTTTTVPRRRKCLMARNEHEIKTFKKNCMQDWSIAIPRGGCINCIIRFNDSSEWKYILKSYFGKCTYIYVTQTPVVVIHTSSNATMKWLIIKRIVHTSGKLVASKILSKVNFRLPIILVRLRFICYGISDQLHKIHIHVY